MRLSEACLEAPDVGALVRGVHVCGGGIDGGGQVGVPKGRPALEGPQLGGRGGTCWVEECAAWVGCSFLPAESGDEPAAGAPEAVCQLLRYRHRPRFRCRGCCAGGWVLWVRQVVVMMVEVKGEADLEGPTRSSRPSCGAGAG